MLDTAQLKEGDCCLYKSGTIVYQRTVAGDKPCHVFRTRKGKEQRLSEAETQKNIWIEIFASEERQ